MSNLRPLILAYQSDVKKMVSFFYDRYQRRDLLRATVEKVIPRSGRMEGLGDYQFHGIGLRCRMNGIEVDVDLGHDDRADGFDAWRLFIYNESCGFPFSDFKSREAIEDQLEGLLTKGLVEKIPDSYNYYWTEEVRKPIT